MLFEASSVRRHNRHQKRSKGHLWITIEKGFGGKHERRFNYLGYVRWENFLVAIKRAIDSCKSSGIEVSDHFRDVTKMIEIGKGGKRKVDDFMLTRYACYLIAQNGDSRKEEIAFAQSYFALQTRKQELIEDRMKLINQKNSRQQKI